MVPPNIHECLSDPQTETGFGLAIRQLLDRRRFGRTNKHSRRAAEIGIPAMYLKERAEAITSVAQFLAGYVELTVFPTF